MRDGPIQLLVIDSSPLFRTRLAAAVQRADGQVEVRGAANTTEARETVIQHHPDVIILDLELTHGDALPFLHKLREHYPVPVFVTCRVHGTTAPTALRAISMGALEVIRKPADARQETFARFGRMLAERIREAYRHARPVPPPRVRQVATPQSWRAAGLDPERHIVVVGASTGGTEALRTLLSNVPGDFPPVVIVQHMPAGFTRNFAERLDQYSPLRVTEAVDHQALAAGMATVARGDTHLEVRRAGRGWRVVYTHQQPVNIHCPSVDVLFESAARAAGPAAIGIILTGMGSDGARGMLAMHQAGALTLAQERHSCVVFGMPKVAIELGGVDDCADPTGLPALALRLVRERREQHVTPG